MATISRLWRALLQTRHDRSVFDSMSFRCLASVMLALVVSLTISAIGIDGAHATEAADDWTPGGHADSEGTSGIVLLALIGAWAGAAALVFLVVRALIHQARFSARRSLSESDCDAISQAIHEAESKTTGEIVAVVLERSDRHPGADWLAAVTTLLLGTAALAGYLPWETPALLVPIQMALGAVGFALSRALPGFKRLFISEIRATEMAGEQAVQEFFGQGTHKTDNATGVLIFVSLLERRVVVLADEGINAKVEDGCWESTDAAILAGIRNGSLRTGLEEGIDRCATVLAEHFPWTEGDRDELENHLIVRRD